MVLSVKKLLPIVLILCATPSYSYYSDEYVKDGKICRRGGKYSSEYCRDPKDSSELNNLISQGRLKSSAPAKTPENSSTETRCQQRYQEKYNQVLYEAIYVDPNKWYAAGYASPQEYAKARARTWIDLSRKYENCK